MDADVQDELAGALKIVQVVCRDMCPQQQRLGALGMIREVGIEMTKQVGQDLLAPEIVCPIHQFEDDMTTLEPVFIAVGGVAEFQHLPGLSNVPLPDQALDEALTRLQRHRRVLPFQDNGDAIPVHEGRHRQRSLIDEPLLYRMPAAAGYPDCDRAFGAAEKTDPTPSDACYWILIDGPVKATFSRFPIWRPESTQGPAVPPASVVLAVARRYQTSR
jgi:hypothetical protein